MSLVGNLEDLSLGDILQIISLSQKSGVLVLQSGQGSGRIVFRSGLVEAACVKGRPDDLRGVLVGGGFIDEAGFEAALTLSSARGASLEQTLAREKGLPAERIEALIREAAEAAILEMFLWQRGDFSFDVRSESDPEDPRLTLASGLNAQYIAMEGMRLRDERAHGGPGEKRAPADPEAEDLDADELSAEAMFGVVSNESDDAQDSIQDVREEAVDIVVETVLMEQEPASRPAIPAPPSPTESVKPARVARPQPAVLIDPDVSALEWVKEVIQSDFVRVHVFQQAEQGLARIRQYVVRGERPVVLLSTATEIDPLSGIRGLGDFVSRLKLQAPGLRVLGLQEASDSVRPVPSELDAVIRRPARRELRVGPDLHCDLAARAFSDALAEALGEPGPAMGDRGGALAPQPRPAPLAELKDVTARLCEASSRGTILPVVIEFASELFARVAVLLVRDQQIVPIAGRGMPALDLEKPAPEPMALETIGEGWIERVLTTGRSVHGPPTTLGDHALLQNLGLRDESRPAYLGPIESGGTVIALVYGGMASSTEPLPDASGLEVVLHHAGLALDRAALERALAEEDGDPVELMPFRPNDPDRV